MPSFNGRTKVGNDGGNINNNKPYTKPRLMSLSSSFGSPCYSSELSLLFLALLVGRCSPSLHAALECVPRRLASTCA